MAESVLTKRLGPKTALELDTLGITNLYQLITYFPINLAEIKPLDNGPFSSKIKYIANLKLINFQLKKSNRPFFLLEFESGFNNLTCYYFTTAKYVFNQLQIGQNYQVILSYKSPFWNVDRLAVLQDFVSDKFILGKAELKPWLLPVYQRILGFTSNKFITLHQRLDTSDYQLNLTGLIPENKLIPNSLSLAGIHRPQSIHHFLETKKQYLIFRVFLQEISFRFIDQNQQQKLALAGTLEPDFLKNLTELIPYDLTNSQKTTIWDILQDLCPI